MATRKRANSDHLRPKIASPDPLVAGRGRTRA